MGEVQQPEPQAETKGTLAEKLPLSSFYNVIDYATIFRSDKWWEAVAVVESYGRRSIAVYLWVKKNDQWKRKHKFQIRNPQEWEKVKEAVDKLMPALSGSKSHTT